MDITANQTGVLISLLAVLGTAGIVGGLIAFYRTGLRLGDRDGDVRVRAARRSVTHPERHGDDAVVTVHNPSAVPVLVSLSVRPTWLPRFLLQPVRVRVPRRSRQVCTDKTVGILAAGDTAHWQLPLPRTGTGARVRVAAGQAGRRLLVVDRLVDDGPVDGQPERRSTLDLAR